MSKLTAGQWMHAAAEEYGVEGEGMALVRATEQASAGKNPPVVWKNVPFKAWRKALERAWKERHPDGNVYRWGDGTVTLGCPGCGQAGDEVGCCEHQNPASVDARLLIPAHEAGWSPWNAARQLHHWFKWWRGHVGHAGRVGSSYNSSPRALWALYQQRVEVDRDLAQWADTLVSPRGLVRNGHGRLAATARLAGKTNKLVQYLKGNVRLPLGRVKTADVRRLSKLSGAFLRWAIGAQSQRFADCFTEVGIDWAAMGSLTQQWETLCRVHRKAFDAFRVPAMMRGKGVFGPVSDVVAVAAADAGWMFQSRWWEGVPQIADLGVLLKAPFAAKAREWANGVLAVDACSWDIVDILSRLIKAAKEKKNIPMEAWTSTHQLREALDALFAGEASGETGRDAMKQAVCRALDRLAQRQPDWAIAQYKFEYDRGQRIAGLCKTVHEHLVNLLESGETLFIHGRDGELQLELLRRDLRWAKWSSRVVYAVTSRPLTTSGGGGAEYIAYLTRKLPKDRPAIHIDTGFAGSIPHWMRANGWDVKEIQLISGAYQMKCTWDFPNLRDIVLGDLEHSSQRLAVMTRDSWEKGFEYDYQAPGFWARLYGICDAMGLPRQVKKGGKKGGR